MAEGAAQTGAATLEQLHAQGEQLKHIQKEQRKIDDNLTTSDCKCTVTWSCPIVASRARNDSDIMDRRLHDLRFFSKDSKWRGRGRLFFSSVTRPNRKRTNEKRSVAILTLKFLAAILPSVCQLGMENPGNRWQKPKG